MPRSAYERSRFRWTDPRVLARFLAVGALVLLWGCEDSGQTDQASRIPEVGAPFPAEEAEDWPTVEAPGDALPRARREDEPPVMEAPEAVAAPAPAPDIVPALDRALQQMIQGRVAFNTPERMMLHEVAGLHAVLDIHLAEEELKQLLQEPGAAETAVLRVADVMSAELSGIAFEISPSGRQEQPISFTEPTDWRWQVKALQEGTHPLHLRFFAVVNVDGTDRTRHIETLNRAIVVDVTGWDKAKRMVAEANWLWASVLLPLAGAFAWWRRRRQVRPPAA